MARTIKLTLHQQLVLLTLRERYGLLSRLRFDSAVAGAILAELHFSGGTIRPFR